MNETRWSFVIDNDLKEKTEEYIETSKKGKSVIIREALRSYIGVESSSEHDMIIARRIIKQLENNIIEGKRVLDILKTKEKI